MIEYYDTYSEEEVSRIKNTIENKECLFDIKINACPWFFTQLTKIVASSLSLYNKMNYQFNIYVTEKDEISVLRYLAAFIVMHKKAGQADDSILFVMPENASEKNISEIYGKISRFLILFYQENKTEIKLHFSKLPNYTTTYIKNNLLEDGQPWPYEKGGFGKIGVPLI